MAASMEAAEPTFKHRAVFSFIVFHFLSNITLCTTVSPTLRLVNILYRHGDRSPVGTYPTNPIRESDWPQGYGQLSKVGMLQHYKLGLFYRQYYRGFLNESYSRYEISIRSSIIDRCLMSGESHLAGLYPPGQSQKFTNLTWQPIPIHTLPDEEDNVLAFGENCPTYNTLFLKSLLSPAVKEEERRNKNFFEYVGNKTGFGHENITNIWQVADTLYCESLHYFALPSWVNQTVIDTLRKLEDFSFTLMFNGTTERRLKGGPLLKLMLQDMQYKINGTNGTLDAARAKMFMYSGHDTTVAALLSTLNVFNDQSPPYASSVLVELHEDPTKSFYVQVFFKNDSTDPRLLTLPGCEAKCPFDTFVKLTADVIPDDWASECGLGQSQPGHNVVVLSFGMVMFGAAIGGGLFLTVMLLLIWVFSGSRKANETRKLGPKYALLDQEDDDDDQEL